MSLGQRVSGKHGHLALEWVHEPLRHLRLAWVWRQGGTSVRRRFDLGQLLHPVVAVAQVLERDQALVLGLVDRWKHLRVVLLFVFGGRVFLNYLADAWSLEAAIHRPVEQLWLEQSLRLLFVNSFVSVSLVVLLLSQLFHIIQLFIVITCNLTRSGHFRFRVH